MAIFHSYVSLPEGNSLDIDLSTVMAAKCEENMINVALITDSTGM